MRIHRYLRPLLACYCIVIVAIPVIFDQPALASLCIPSFTEPDAYHYIRALINAMAHAKIAVERLGETKPADTASDIALSILYELRLAKADFEYAASHVDPFSENPSELISKSAVGASVAFLKLAELMDDERERFKQLLDMPRTKSPHIGTMLDQRAGHMVSLDNAWRLLIPAATMATYAIVAKEVNTGLYFRLSLTANERSEVLKDLRSTFGNEVTRGPQAGQIPLLAAAAIFYEVIGNQGRATREAAGASVQDILGLTEKGERSVKPMFKEIQQLPSAPSVTASAPIVATNFDYGNG